jgi:hypothetical protein
MTIRSLVQSEISHDTAHQTQCQHKHTTMTIFRTVHCANQINVSIWSVRWLQYYNYYYGDITSRSAELPVRERGRGTAASVCQVLVTSYSTVCFFNLRRRSSLYSYSSILFVDTVSPSGSQCLIFLLVRTNLHSPSFSCSMDVKFYNKLNYYWN